MGQSASRDVGEQAEHSTEDVGSVNSVSANENFVRTLQHGDIPLLSSFDPSLKLGHTTDNGNANIFSGFNILQVQEGHHKGERVTVGTGFVRDANLVEVGAGYNNVTNTGRIHCAYHKPMGDACNMAISGESGFNSNQGVHGFKVAGGVSKDLGNGMAIFAGGGANFTRDFDYQGYDVFAGSEVRRGYMKAEVKASRQNFANSDGSQRHPRTAITGMIGFTY